MGRRKKPNVTKYRPTYKDRHGTRRMSSIWWLQFSVDGKQHRVNTGHDDELAAEKARDVLQGKLLLAVSGEGPPSSLQTSGAKAVGVTLGALLARYLKGVKAEGHSTKHYDAVELATERLLAVLGGPQADATSVSTDAVRDAMTVWRSEKLGNSIIRKTLLVLRAAYKDAADDDLIQKVPFTIKKLPKVTARDVVVPQTDYASLNKSIDFNKPLDRALAIAMYTGLRIGDIQALTWDQVDLGGAPPTIKVTPKKTNQTSGVGVVIPLFEPLLGWLSSVPESDRAGNLVVHGAHISHPLAKRIQETLGEGCPFTAHSFRHTVADRLKHNPLLAKQIGGWTSLKMVDWYASPTGMREAGRLMSEALAPPGTKRPSRASGEGGKKRNKHRQRGRNLRHNGKAPNGRG